MGAICSCKCCGCSKQKPQPPQPQPKIEPKPVIKIEPKPEPIPEPKPEPKPDPIPEPKQEPKVETNLEFYPPENILPPTEKPTEVQQEQSDQDEKEFDNALTVILDRNNAFKENKNDIENQLNALFKKDQYYLKDCSENPDFKGPKIANRNICDIVNKFDFSGVNEFQEYRRNITLVRLIQKQKSPICTYVGIIEDKYCCVKLLPMQKRTYILQWIERVKQAQKISNDIIIEEFCQKYYYYKIEEVKNEPEYCNCYIISQLEQYNTYTFSHHPSITLAEKVNVAYKVIQIISLVLKSRLDQDKQNERLSVQLFKKMFTVKRNNILISREKSQKGNYKLLLSDWQLLLEEFEVIIPNHKLQNQDKNFEKNEKCIQFLQSVSGNLRSAEQLQFDIDLNKNLQELDDFTKKVLRLIIFRVNLELLENVELTGFINENKFIEIRTKINTIEKNERADYENLKQIIQRYTQNHRQGEDDKYQNPEEVAKNLQNQLSLLIVQEFGFNNTLDYNLLYQIYLMLQLLPSEAIRPALKDLKINHLLTSQIEE